MLVALLGLAMKVGMAHWVRFNVLAPATRSLSTEELQSFYTSSKLLCVGCTSGLGEGIARHACLKGAKVVVVGRREPSAMMVACPKVEFIKADLSKMQTAQRVARQVKSTSFDTVLFTVGIFTGPEKKISEEGIEMDTAVSFLSRFVMSQELIGAGLASSPSRKPRIFVMGFCGNPSTPQLDDFNWDNKPFAWYQAHQHTVVGNDALVMGLAKRHAEVNVYGLNPGIMKTGIMSTTLGEGSFLWHLQQLVIEAIAPAVDDYVPTVLQLMATPELESLSGAFFNQGGEQISAVPWLLAAAEHPELLWAAAQTLAERALSWSPKQ